MSTLPLAQAVAVAPDSGWHLLGVHAYVGHALGCRGPSLELRLRVTRLLAADRAALWQCVQQACPALEAPVEPPDEGEMDNARALNWLLAVWQRVQQAQGVPVFETGRRLSAEGPLVRCLLPVGTQAHQRMAQVVAATLQWLQARTDDGNHSGTFPHEEDLSRALKGLADVAAQGSNVPRFLKAAWELGLPTLALPGGVIQYGLGRRARWLDSSFTDETPTIAAKLARHKRWASALLAQAGLPVAPQALVADADQAANAAGQLGYPVVVKPADLDGGVGVAAGLDDEQEVREAFAAARKHSAQIVVEKHIHGRDYRLTVFRGELIWAVERIPAGVTGDGSSTVVQLMDQVNSDPRRGVGPHALFKRLVLDETARKLLIKQGLDEYSTPAEGEFVFFRKAANTNTGGQPIAVFDKVHPDNAQLAVRAAKAVGLDVAGIDLLMPDIQSSWTESRTQTAICEVNGQPQLGPTHLYTQVLKRLIVDNGRVPIILVLGAEHPERWLAVLGTALQARGLCVGTAGRDGVSVGGERLTEWPIRLMAAGRMLALNRQVDAMVLCISEDSLLRTGLPWARYDALVLAGRHWPSASQETHPPQDHPARPWLQHLLPACDGVVMAHQAAGLRVEGVDKLTSACWMVSDGSLRETAAEVVRWAVGEQGELR